MVRKTKIDEIDMKIIGILEKNSRVSNTKISKILGLSEAAIRKRIEKLKKMNIIKKFSIIVDYSLLGYKIVIIGVDVEKNKILDVIKNIPNIENIKALYTAIGDHDLLIEFVYKDKKEIDNFIDLLKKIDGIEKVCPAIIVDRIF